MSLADVESSHVARIASAFANESRIDLVKAMWNGPVEAQTLSTAANLRGGQLYFHINELSQAGLLIKVGKLYCLSVLGRHIASVLLLIGSKSQGGALVEHPIE